MASILAIPLVSPDALANAKEDGARAKHLEPQGTTGSRSGMIELCKSGFEMLHRSYRIVSGVFVLIHTVTSISLFLLDLSVQTTVCHSQTVNKSLSGGS
jgi:hypothetical protein